MHEVIAFGPGSEAVVGRGFPEPLLPTRPGRTGVAILHQPAVLGVAQRVVSGLEPGLRLATIALPDRDEAKTWKVMAGIYDRLAELNLGRGDTVIGVGGGAVTDVAGFTAATWLRGVESVLVPTTLLGAVDAAIGGKTGINHAGKNLVGAFWLPTRVVVDLEILDRLPEALLVEGLAEVVKAGFLAAPSIIDALELGGVRTDLDEIVGPAIAMKAAVVRDDPTERGRRAILNLGHTIGHGIEVVGRLSHGYAVSVGMVAAAAISEARYGFDPTRMVGLLAALGLPAATPGLDPARVRALVARDKKRVDGELRMVLLRGIGDPVVEPVTDAELSLGLRAVGIG